MSRRFALEKGGLACTTGKWGKQWVAPRALLVHSVQYELAHAVLTSRRTSRARIVSIARGMYALSHRSNRPHIGTGPPTLRLAVFCRRKRVCCSPRLPSFTPAGITSIARLKCVGKYAYPPLGDPRTPESQTGVSNLVLTHALTHGHVGLARAGRVRYSLGSYHSALDQFYPRLKMNSI
jgi:hypothetical protein